VALAEYAEYYDYSSSYPDNVSDPLALCTPEDDSSFNISLLTHTERRHGY